MEVIEVDAQLYNKSLKPFSIFTSTSFSLLNSHKVEKVYYLLFKDTKVRLGIILGKIGANLYSPFSAPYGSFSYAEPDCKAKAIDSCIQALNDWCLNNHFEKLFISLPAQHYNPQFIDRLVNGFFSHEYTIDNIDVNHHFEIPPDFDVNYPQLLQRNARKNLNNALKQSLFFIRLDENFSSRAYDIIALNRAAKQKPLRLTLSEIKEVSAVTEIDFFVVEHSGVDVAAAIVFGINHNTVQVVYWGDDPKYAELRSMNYLTYKVFQYYALKGIRVLEIGISTESSKPNYGLCEFKESIGCSLSLKYSFSKIFNVSN